MKNQVENYKFKKDLLPSMVIALLGNILLALLILSAICSFIISSWMLITCILLYIDLYKDIKKQIFIRKSQEFIANELEINEAVKRNKDILENTNTKTKKVISPIIENNKDITLNSIYKLELEELRQIIENTYKCEQLEFDLSSKDVKQKSYGTISRQK